ncbi:hypothetical protein [Lactobacillus hominis]|uniref:hypothetical protein n=1 Tax=Lactobacillus hominis TaxID=1203033 RepID=UPI0023F3C584|nr:hypothetical protein [Lactobacillus hominis]
MTIRIIPFSEIPFDELTHEYMFNQKMSFKPVVPFKSTIVAQSGGQDKFGNTYLYQEWANGNKAYMIRQVTGNPPMNHIKSNYDLKPDE